MLCPECKKNLPESIDYCIYCGTKTSLSQNLKKERLLFVLTPLVLIAVCIGISYDLGSRKPLISGIQLGSIACLIYFFSALFFNALKTIIKIWSAPGCSFNAGISAVINITTTLAATFVLENLFLTEYIAKSGPTRLAENHLYMILGIFLPLQFIETIAVSAKVKAANVKVSKGKESKHRLFGTVYITIPVLFILITAIGYYSLPETTQVIGISKIYNEFRAESKSGEILDAALEKYPNDPQLCIAKVQNILSSLQDSRHNSQALELAKIAVTASPTSVINNFYLGLAYEFNNEPSKAIETASFTASLARTDSFLWQHLGNLCMKQNKLSDAINAYSEGLKHSPENSGLLNNLSYALLENNQQSDLALEFAKRAVEQEPTSIIYRDTLAWAHYKNKNYNDALEEMNIIFEGRSEISPEIDFHYAMILNEVDLLDKPLEAFDKMLVKPEILLNKKLMLQILDARIQTEKKQKEGKEAKERKNQSETDNRN